MFAAFDIPHNVHMVGLYDGTLKQVLAPLAQARSGRSDANQIKVLSLETCSDDQAAYQTWAVRTVE